jgi:hypothetical protein
MTISATAGSEDHKLRLGAGAESDEAAYELIELADTIKRLLGIDARTFAYAAQPGQI